LLRASGQHGISEILAAVLELWHGHGHGYKKIQRKSTGDDPEDPASSSETRLLNDEQAGDTFPIPADDPEGVLSMRETAKLSLQFSLVWFIANYLMAACLEYTSVASSTILTSTSSIWTLILGAAMRVERFSYKKLLGVLASLTGIILISSVDLAGKDNDENRGSFPHKSQAQIAVGDTMAFGSAIMYGAYTVLMKKRIGNEDRVNMPLFFGLVGLFNVVFLWPGFLILHFSGVETFELPPAGRIWTIIIVRPLTPFLISSNTAQLNSLSSFISDYCWAYAMLLTSPLVVTVGLSMSIPLSLIGQIVLSSQYSGAWYWVGAFVVLISFLFINHETREDEPSKPHQAGDDRLDM
jgi:solute carrier family 35 protein F5